MAPLLTLPAWFCTHTFRLPTFIRPITVHYPHPPPTAKLPAHWLVAVGYVCGSGRLPTFTHDGFGFLFRLLVPRISVAVLRTPRLPPTPPPTHHTCNTCYRTPFAFCRTQILTYSAHSPVAPLIPGTILDMVPHGFPYTLPMPTACPCHTPGRRRERGGTTLNIFADAVLALARRRWLPSPSLSPVCRRLHIT